MSHSRVRRITAALLVTCAWSLPQQTVQADNLTEEFNRTTEASTTRVAFAVTDVELGRGGTLTGRLVGVDGTALAGEELLIRDAQGRETTVTTDQHGDFALGELQGGVIQLAAFGVAFHYRVWMPGTAPPGTPSRLLQPLERSTVRAQWTPKLLNKIVRRTKVAAAKPPVVAGVLFAAVGIPVWVHNANIDNAPSSP